MRLLLLAIAGCLLISPLARADGVTGATADDVSAQQERFVRAMQLRRMEETVKLDRTREDANLARERQLQSIDDRRLEERVRALEAAQGAR